MKMRGVVLVSVLWLLVLLGLLAAGTTRAVSTERRLVGQLVASAQGRAAAEGGLYLGLLALLEPRGEWVASGGPREFSIGGATVSVRYYDEAGRIDLNTAPAELLSGLFASVGVEPDEGEALADAILDWRDADHLRQLHGAEDPEYRALGRDYGARDGDFSRVDELSLVAGMQRELFERVRPSLTVYSGQPGVNPQLASRNVLLAVPGVSTEAVESYLQLRAEAPGSTSTIAPEGMAHRYQSGARGRVYTLSATAHLPSARAGLAMTVSLQRTADRRWTVLDWGEADEE